MDHSIAEKLLLCRPNIIKYYHARYQLYTLLNVPFDLFFTEDIYGYKEELYIFDLICYYSYKTEVINSLKNPVDVIINGSSCKEDDLHQYNLNDMIAFHTKSKQIIYAYDKELYTYSIRSLIDTIFSKTPFTQKQLDMINRIRNNNYNLDIKDVA